MQRPVNRRTLLAAAPVALGTLLLDPTRALFGQPGGPVALSALDERYPSQDDASVRQVVGASHFSLEKVQALVDKRPELAKSSWDWGFGDWETALGAASHTGNHDIAQYLIDHGARPDIFTAAMMGNLAAVQAFIEMTPGIQGLPGPHGITMRRHAELGGERARPVLEYLDMLGGADVETADPPLPYEQDAYVGTYAFGKQPEDRFEIAVGNYEKLTIQRGTGTARTLFHQGESTFHPAGAPSAQVRFQVTDGAVRGLAIHNPDLVVSALRAAS